MKRNYIGLALVVAGLMVAGAERAAADGAIGTPLRSEGISHDLGRRDFITLAVPDLTKLSKLNAGKFPEERVMDVIDGRIDVKVHGLRDMPVWGDWFNREAASADTGKAAREMIVNERIASLITYIKSIQEK